MQIDFEVTKSALDDRASQLINSIQDQISRDIAGLKRRLRQDIKIVFEPISDGNKVNVSPSSIQKKVENDVCILTVRFDPSSESNCFWLMPKLLFTLSDIVGDVFNIGEA